MGETPSSSSADNTPRMTERRGADGARELVLVKGDQRYVFACAPGDEAMLLMRLCELARDPNVNLSWYDAAQLSHRVGGQLGEQLQHLRQG